MAAQQKERCCDVLQKEDPEDCPTSVLVKHFHFCGYDLKISRYMSENLGVSSFVWDCSLELCKFFEQEKMSFSGKKVIELGSGTGIVGILAAMLGGQVTLTDQSHVLKQIEHNVSASVPASCRHSATVSVLSWGSDHTQFPSDYDVILGTDIVYFPSDYSLLMQTLRHLSNPRTTIYLASDMRGYYITHKFHEEHIPQYFNSHIVHRNVRGNINVYKLSVK